MERACECDRESGEGVVVNTKGDGNNRQREKKVYMTYIRSANNGRPRAIQMSILMEKGDI